MAAAALLLLAVGLVWFWRRSRNVRPHVLKWYSRASQEPVAGNEKVVARKAESLNADLAKAGVYAKLDQKAVTFWLDLRNKAAHAKYTEYAHEQVELMYAGVRDFVMRNPR